MIAITPFPPKVYLDIVARLELRILIFTQTDMYLQGTNASHKSNKSLRTNHTRNNSIMAYYTHLCHEGSGIGKDGWDRESYTSCSGGW